MSPDHLANSLILCGGRHVLDAETALESTEVTSLRVPSGCLGRCAPAGVPDTWEPYDRRIPPGQYPVVFTARTGGAQPVVAFVSIRLGSGRAAVWKRSKPSELEFPDALAGLADEELVGALESLGDEEYDGLWNSLQWHRFADAKWAKFAVPERGGGEVFCFENPQESDVCPTYWSLSDSGRLESLTVDLGVLPLEVRRGWRLPRWLRP